MNDTADLIGIRQAAQRLGVTHRALRFYEDQGLIEPQRIGQTQVYSRREMGRMQLILRAKRLGFSIREIKEFLDLYDADPEQAEQTRHVLTKVRSRLDALIQQRQALNETIRELQQIEAESAARLRGTVPSPTG